MKALGLDVGGSGIKGALVDTKTGELLSERLRVPTPESLLPRDTIGAMVELVGRFESSAPVLGIGFPSVVQNGVPRSPFTAHRIQEWVGFPLGRKLEEQTGRSVTVLNDADAAGLAEVRFGAAGQEPGVVLLLTLGTGVGSALFVGGRLLPNTELGSLYLKNQKKRSEFRAASVAKKRDGLTWREYAKHLNDYLLHVNALFSPDVIVIGGGVSKKHQKFLPFLAQEVGQKTVPATMGNNAGIIGAALAAVEGQEMSYE